MKTSSITTETIKSWKKALAPMTKELKSKSTYDEDWGWTQGGCFAFAEAFRKVFGGTLYGIALQDPDSKDYPVTHALVKLGGKFYDYTGEVRITPAYLKKYAMPGSGYGEPEVRPKTAIGTYWFEDEFLNDAQVKDLVRILKKAKQNKESAGMKHIETATTDRLSRSTVISSDRAVPPFTFKNQQIAKEFADLSLSQLWRLNVPSAERKYVNSIEVFQSSVRDFLECIEEQTSLNERLSSYSPVGTAFIKALSTGGNLYPIYRKRIDSLIGIKGAVKLHKALSVPQFKTLFSQLGKDLKNFEAFIKANPAQSLPQVKVQVEEYLKSLQGWVEDSRYDRGAYSGSSTTVVKGLYNKSLGVFVSLPTTYTDRTVKLKFRPLEASDVTSVLSLKGLESKEQLEAKVAGFIKECSSYAKTLRSRMKAVEKLLGTQGFTLKYREAGVYSRWKNEKTNLKVSVRADVCTIITPNKSIDFPVIGPSFDANKILSLLTVKKAKQLTVIPKGAALGKEGFDLMSDYFAYSNLGGDLSEKGLLKILKEKGLQVARGRISGALDQIEGDVGVPIGGEINDWRSYISKTPLVKIASIHTDMKPIILWLLSEGL